MRLHKLKPWRHHLWLSAKIPRDEHFAKLVHTLVELYTRPLTKSDFTNLDDLAERLMAYVSEWNTQAHPFNWSTKSAARVMAKCEAQTVRVPAA